MFAPKFKAKAPSGSGIWTPKTQTPATSLNNLYDRQSSRETPPPPPLPNRPIWTPQPSPCSGRKEFRPVRFESPTLPRRYVVQQPANTPPAQPPWSTTSNDYATLSPRSTNSCTNLSTPTTIGSVSSNPFEYYQEPPEIGTNKRSSSISDKIKTFERSASATELHRPFARRPPDSGRPIYRPNEVIYKVKHEYLSEPESENERPKRMAQLARRQYDGIGPVTNDGMPIILRSEVKEPHQHEWYKRLYQTIHKQKHGDDYVIRYKCPRGRHQFKTTGYQSEPEPNYDSDYSTVKYRTLDRRRLLSSSSAANVRSGANFRLDDKCYGTMPNPIKSGQNSYKNQPGRIEDYITGHSSVSEKEKKEWWDEVMDIFNGHLDQTKLSPQYTEGNLSRALAKESGYTSDSNLVFRKKEAPLSSALSPIEQKQAYKSVQSGGEPPLFGFRKPAPERPKGFVEEIEYIQISPTLTKIRVSCKGVDRGPYKSVTTISQPEETEIFTPEPTPDLQNTKDMRSNMFTPFPKDLPSFIPLSQRKASPPVPPQRQSSCTKTSIKIESSRSSKPQPNTSGGKSSRHEQCFKSPESPIATAYKYGTVTLRKQVRREPISRSKSAGAVSTLLTSLTSVKPSHDTMSIAQQTRVSSVSPSRRQTRVFSLRQSSRSPVAFGRSISKERTFAEEKKRLENTLPLSRSTFEASTNILRDPSLRSPQDVKAAMRSYAACAAHMRSKSLPRLRPAPPTPSLSVNTTMRHTMCFPQTHQTKLVEYGKPVQRSTATTRTAVIPKQPIRHSKNVLKNVSTLSLARTNSTFSVESNTSRAIAPKAKLTGANVKVASKPSTAPKSSKPSRASAHQLQNSKSDGQLGRKRSFHSGGQTSKRVSKVAVPNPVNMEESHTTHYFQDAMPITARDDESLFESVRDKTNFWNDINTKKSKSLMSAVPDAQYVSYHKSRSLSPSRHYVTEKYVEDFYKTAEHDSEFGESSYIDDLVWQYEQKGGKAHRSKSPPAVMDIARPESPSPKRKFSPTREVRVQQTARHESRSKSPIAARPLTPTLTASGRKFSPTREVRVPQTSRHEQTSKSPRSNVDTIRSVSPPTARHRKFSPTREVRIAQTTSTRSETRDKSPTAVVDTSRSASPILHKRKFSPTREVRVQQSARNVRSPSRRRIDHLRTNSKGETSKVIRASSLSSADDQSNRGLYLCGDLAHSATSLTYLERHSPTCRYRNNSERFTDLNRFYSTLERVGQLERATSMTNFKPIRKDSELLDFDEWRKVRLHERAEKELHYLVDKLKQDQRTKDLVFRPKDADDVKWRKETDFGLHSKEKSVEDLRDNFERKPFLKESEQMLRKNYYRPYWRRNTVADLASNLEVKYNGDQSLPYAPEMKVRQAEEREIHLSNRLVSTLSKEQIVKISQQLNDIYSNNTKAKDGAVSEEYVVTVDHESKPMAPIHSLKVRCNSSITKEDLLGPVMHKKEVISNALQVRPKYTTDRKKEAAPITKSAEKRVQTQKSESEAKVAKGTRGSSPVFLARETRGAIAAQNAEVTLTKPPKIPPHPELAFERKHEPQNVTSHYDRPRKQISSHEAFEGRSNFNEPSTSDTQVLHKARESADNISQKIQFFEDRQFDEPPKTVYHAREDSSPDEGEVMRIIEENIKSRAQQGFHQHKEMSSSLTDLRDLFGERASARVNFHLHSPPQRPPDENDPGPMHDMDTFKSEYDLEYCSPHSSIELYDAYYRSRSLSPQSQESSYLHRVHTGEVQKIKEKFESIGCEQDQHDFFGVSTLRKVRSDPELKALSSASKDAFKTLMNSDECGDVSWIAHKFEVRHQSMDANDERGRPRRRSVISPTSQKNRLMPHIDIISKTAALKQEMQKKPSNKPTSPTRSSGSNGTTTGGMVERIRSQYENASPSADPSRYMSSSNPDLRDVAAISQHLTANWIAHKYPSPKDNTYTGNNISESDSSKRNRRIRSHSNSPPRPPKSTQHQKTTVKTNVLKPYYEDIFANQKFDPKMHQPKARYVPDGAEANDWKKLATAHHACSGNCIGLKKSMAVTFQAEKLRNFSQSSFSGGVEDGKDFIDITASPTPPQPPVKGVPLDQNGHCIESPNRYYESDVNIHFKTPVRHEYKEPIPEEELAMRQAEHMQKLYQEERRRKYLQELQDMNARRHTDNFTPSQKSPIPLNRYDDFESDLAPTSPNTVTYPKAVARALYNFQGQSARELSFRKGDVIYIRRQIDKNWYEGEHNAMIGLFPANYVELINKDGGRQPARKPSEGQARAKYNFQAQSGVELSLNKGELVTLTRRVDDNWFEGKIANRKGIFPVSYVEVLTDIGAEDIAAKTVITEHSTTNLRPSLDTLRTNINNEFNSITQNGHHPPNGILKETKSLPTMHDALHVDTNSEPITYRALYKYRPQNADELELLEGDVVHVLEKCDDGWFVGTSQRTGCFGTFPGNYVERL